MIMDETIVYQRKRGELEQTKLPTTITTITTDDDTESIHQCLALASPTSWCPMDDSLAYNTTMEHPIICQLGGNHPSWAYEATTQVLGIYHYDGIDLNCGCPSTRAKGREFGAMLMKPQGHDTAVAMVEQMKHAMQDVQQRTKKIYSSDLTSEQQSPDMEDPALIEEVDNQRQDSNAPLLPNLSVKLRIGVDEHEGLDFMVDFLEKLRPHCKHFILHARKVYTKGLNPAQNRSIPKLNYDMVYQVCRRFPDCHFWINGGIDNLITAKELCYGRACINTNGHEAYQDDNGDLSLDSTGKTSLTDPPLVAPPNLQGCMLGRAVRDNPSILWDVDRYFYGKPYNPCRNRRQVIDQYTLYLERLYPKRCCDVVNDPDNDADPSKLVTTKLPAPRVPQSHSCCGICQSIEHYCKTLRERTSTSDISGGQEHRKGKLRQRKVYDANGKEIAIKISSHIIGRCLKPANGLFVGLKGSRPYRRICAFLVLDPEVRNCGPAFILRLAVKHSIPDEVLDQDFVPTEQQRQLF